MKLNQSTTYQGLPESPSKLSVASVLQIVIDLRTKLNDELRNIRFAFNGELNAWELLQQHRHQQGFVSTKAQVRIYAVAAGEHDRAQWETEINEEVDERRAEHEHRMDEYEQRNREYRKYRRSRGKSGDGQQAAHEDEAAVAKPTKPEEWEEERVKNEVIQKALDERRNPTESIKTIRLDFNGRVDSDEAIRQRAFYLKKFGLKSASKSLFMLSLIRNTKHMN